MGFENTHLTITRYEEDERFVEYFFRTQGREEWNYGHLNNKFCLMEIQDICALTERLEFKEGINKESREKIKSIIGLN